MSYDNRILSINGESFELFKLAIEVAFLQRDKDGRCRMRSWEMNPKIGLVLQWFGDKLPAPGLNSNSAAIMAWEWLSSEEASKIPTDGFDAFNVDIDGDVDRGWKVWVGDWGEIYEAGTSTICAVKPVGIWRGK